MAGSEQPSVHVERLMMATGAGFVQFQEHLAGLRGDALRDGYQGSPSCKFGASKLSSTVKKKLR